jgi:hypothetical protein
VRGAEIWRRRIFLSPGEVSQDFTVWRVHFRFLKWLEASRFESRDWLNKKIPHCSFPDAEISHGDVVTNGDSSV